MSEWKLVPRNYTDAMYEAGETAFENGYIDEMWDAMLAAAPQPPADIVLPPLPELGRPFYGEDVIELMRAAVLMDREQRR